MFGEIDTREEEEQLKSLVRLSKVIFSLYKRLSYLEIDKKKDTMEYKRELFSLVNMLKAEEQSYKNLTYRMDLIYGISSYLCAVADKEKDTSIFKFESSFDEYNKGLIFDRVTGFMDGLVHEIEARINKNMGKSKKEKLDFDLVCLYVNGEVFKKYMVILQNNTDNKFSDFNTYLSNFKMDDFMNKIVITKYITSFINRNLEKCLIDSEFEISSSIFKDYRYDQDILKICNDNYDTIKEDFIIPLIKNNILDIKKVNNSKFKDLNEMLNIILDSLSLRASLLMLNEEEIERVKSEFIKNSKTINGRNCYKVILEAFAMTSTDREKLVEETKVLIK